VKVIEDALEDGTGKSDPTTVSYNTDKLTPENVCYYSHTLMAFVDEYGKEQANVLKRKALLFLTNGCIKYIGEGWFECAPLEGYNTRFYNMKKREGKTGNIMEVFSCNCQGYQKKLKDGKMPGCSHTLALSLHFKLQKKEEGVAM